MGFPRDKISLVSLSLEDQTVRKENEKCGREAMTFTIPVCENRVAFYPPPPPPSTQNNTNAHKRPRDDLLRHTALDWNWVFGVFDAYSIIPPITQFH